MRMQKYRAWETLNERMVYWDKLKKARLSIINWENECHPDNVNEFKVMQFTGLHDKNTVELYEDDMIKNGEEYYRIVFEDGCFYGRNSGNMTELWKIISNAEQVGNIWVDQKEAKTRGLIE